MFIKSVFLPAAFPLWEAAIRSLKLDGIGKPPAVSWTAASENQELKIRNGSTESPPPPRSICHYEQIYSSLILAASPFYHSPFHSVLPAFLSFFASFLPSILTASLNLLAPVLHLDAWQTNIDKAVWWQHTGPSAGAVHAAYAACKLTSVPACVYGHAFYACASICVHVQCLLSPWAVASVNHELDIFALEHKNCECKICAGYQHWRPFKNWND